MGNSLSSYEERKGVGGIFISHPCWDIGSRYDGTHLLKTTFSICPAVVLLTAGGNSLWRTGSQSHRQQVLGRWCRQCARLLFPLPTSPVSQAAVPGRAGRGAWPQCKVQQQLKQSL